MKNFTAGNRKSCFLFLKIKPALFVLLFLLFSGINAQENFEVIQLRNIYWMVYSDASNSLYNHIAGQAFEILEKRANEVSEINSLTGWQKRQKKINETLNEIIGPFPEKTDLNAKITKTIRKEDYTIENIIFESQPDFYVTSSLYIPEAASNTKAPAIIYCSGHTAEGYRSKAYQHKIINLVKKGFIVFAFDPVGQGERLEYPDSETGMSILGGPTREHSYAGAQAFISGSSQARYMIWDGVRAIDYLLTREEVDPERIGITGRSGGGTQSAYIAAIDDRIHAVAPEAYITSFTRLLQTIGPQDAEQNLYHGIKHGIDHADLLAVRAPKPALLVATTNDFFSIQGSREAAREVSHIYDAYGKPDNFGMVEDIGGHASTRNNREAMYAFFQKHLNNPGSPFDQEVEIPGDDELKVTLTGQISTSLDGETVFSLNRRESEMMSNQLNETRKDQDKHLSSVINAAKELSGYQSPGIIGEPVFTGQIKRDGYMIEKYFIQGEGDYIIPYLLMIPEQPGSRALIYLHPSGKSAGASPGGEMEWFVRKGFTVLAPDLVGIGEMGPGDFRGDAYIEGISYNIWFASTLIGRSITGIRAGDVVRLTWLLRDNKQFEDIYAMAKGKLSPVLLHAAAFEPSISRVALVEPYSSYSSIVMNRFYNPAFIHGAVPGALKAYDLPDLAAAIAPRKLMLVNVVDGTNNLADMKGINEDLSAIKNAYQYRNALLSLFIESGQDIDACFYKWIEK